MELRFTEMKKRKKTTKRARKQNWDDPEWKIIGNPLEDIEIREPYKYPIQTYGICLDLF